MTMGRRYSLDDPALQETIEDRAQQVAAEWPALDDKQRARLASLLADSAPRATSATTVTRMTIAPDRRAA